MPRTGLVRVWIRNGRTEPTEHFSYGYEYGSIQLIFNSNYNYAHASQLSLG